MDRLGLGYDAVRAVNPRAIYCSITGYGQDGPRAQEAGHDLNYQSVTGLLSLSPSMPASLVADIAGGAMPAVMNILLALRHRDFTGEGTYLDIAMADAMFTFSWFALAQGHANGHFPGAGENMLAGASPRYALYETADGQYLAVGALEQKFWDTFCEALALDARLRNDGVDPAATRDAIQNLIRSRSAQAWRDLLHPLDCCCTIMSSLDEAYRDEHFRGRGLFDAHVQAGNARLPAATVPIASVFRGDPEAIRPVPSPGQHTKALLKS
jgi:crotonobetainyl-CoA:carnitine CoA-transferase CaiB-like acyl-CoA transferase